MAEGSFNGLQIVPIRTIGQCGAMLDPLLLFIAAAFLLAGFVKGVIGLGLPTVSMGLLAVAMPPIHFSLRRATLKAIRLRPRMA